MANGEAVDPTLVYELKNRTFNNDGSIDTGIAYLTTDKSFTIMCDADFAGQRTSEKWALFKMMNSTWPYNGVAFTREDSSFDYSTFFWMTSRTDSHSIPLAASYVGKVKLVLTHSAGSDAMTYYVKVGKKAVVTSGLSATFRSINANLAVGGSVSNNQSFNGTVNKFAVYDTVKSSAEINAFLA